MPMSIAPKGMQNVVYVINKQINSFKHNYKLNLLKAI